MRVRVQRMLRLVPTPARRRYRFQNGRRKWLTYDGLGDEVAGVVDEHVQGPHVLVDVLEGREDIRLLGEITLERVEGAWCKLGLELLEPLDAPRQSDDSHARRHQAPNQLDTDAGRGARDHGYVSLPAIHFCNWRLGSGGRSTRLSATWLVLPTTDWLLAKDGCGL